MFFFQYWRCVNGAGVQFTCQPNTVFNVKLNVCDWPENANRNDCSWFGDTTRRLWVKQWKLFIISIHTLIFVFFRNLAHECSSSENCKLKSVFYEIIYQNRFTKKSYFCKFCLYVYIYSAYMYAYTNTVL